MKSLQKIINLANAFQQKHHFSAFGFAVIKKYGDDEAGKQAALLTYYGFLSLFPLLLILTTLTDNLIGTNTHIGNAVIKGLTNYFPLLGSQLSSHVHSLHTDGLALITGILFTLYGSRGVANAFTSSVQRIWLIPDKERPGFPKSLIKSLVLIIVGGGGLLGASVIAGLTSSAGHGLVFRTLAILVNMLILFCLFSFLLNFSLPKRVTLADIWLGAVVATIGLMILQSLGGYILAHELKHLSALYSYFAVALGLLFWIYLQTQVIFYAIEIAIVSSQKLWPRSLDANMPLPVDKKLAVVQVR